MATSMTSAQLRGLARLYRQRVDGAAETLASIIRHSAYELPELLGVTHKSLERLHRADDPIELLVVTIEAAPRVARETRNEIAFDAASALAPRLAATAERRAGGHVALDVELLGEMLTRYPGRIVTFGALGSCGSLRLRAILRELRTVRTMSVVLTHEHVVVTYDAQASRGLIRLRLHDHAAGERALVIPLEETRDRRGQHHEDVRAEHRATDRAIEHVAHEESSQPEESRETEVEVDRAPVNDERPRLDVATRNDNAAPSHVVVEGRAVPRELPTNPARRTALRMLDLLVAGALGAGP